MGAPGQKRVLWALEGVHACTPCDSVIPVAANSLPSLSLTTVNQREGLGANREFFNYPFESDLGQNVQDVGWSLENSPVPGQAGILGQAGAQHSVTGLQLFKSLFFKKSLCYIVASEDIAVTVREMAWTCVS